MHRPLARGGDKIDCSIHHFCIIFIAVFSFSLKLSNISGWILGRFLFRGSPKIVGFEISRRQAFRTTTERSVFCHGGCFYQVAHTVRSVCGNLSFWWGGWCTFGCLYFRERTSTYRVFKETTVGDKRLCSWLTGSTRSVSDLEKMMWSGKTRAKFDLTVAGMTSITR